MPGIYVISAEGRNERRIARTDDVGFSWSPDSTRVAVSIDALRGGGDDIYDLYSVPVTGGPIRRLTRTKVYSERSPAWSPDGEKIAFEALDERTESDWWQIWVMNADGTRRQRLSPLTTFAEEDLSGLRTAGRSSSCTECRATSIACALTARGVAV